MHKRNQHFCAKLPASLYKQTTPEANTSAALRFQNQHSNIYPVLAHKTISISTFLNGKQRWCSETLKEKLSDKQNYHNAITSGYRHFHTEFGMLQKWQIKSALW
jgi:hypothetical protein